MNKTRVNEILNQKMLNEVYYNERPVWIQEVHDYIAKISFIDNYKKKNVYIEDLYENDLYE